MASPGQICRLCFNVISNNFVILDQLKTEMLAEISLYLDLSFTDEPLVCFECQDILQRSYDFKMMCLSNEKHYLQIFLNCDSNIEQGEENICRLCLKQLDDSFVKFAVNGDTFFRNMVLKCLPEIESIITNQPLICHDCLNNCQNMFTLVTNCLNKEEKIKKIVQTNGTTSSGQVNLNNIREFVFDMEKDEKMVESSLYSIKQETLREDINGAICDTEVKKEEHEQLVEDEIDIKSEEDILLKDEIGNDSYSSQDNTDSTQEHKSTLCSFETNKHDLYTHVQTHTTHLKSPAFKCTECSYQSPLKRYLSKHMLKHKDASEVTMHKCTECGYESRYKQSLQRHSVIHKGLFEVMMHKCTMCSYETRHQRWLKNHLLIHKDKSELPTHKCAECSFESKRKSSLRNHVLIHKNSSQLSMFRCTECEYESKFNWSLQQHMLVHKKKSEVATFSCTECKFETKYRKSLYKHLLGHNVWRIEF